MDDQPVRPDADPVKVLVSEFEDLGLDRMTLLSFVTRAILETEDDIAGRSEFEHGLLHHLLRALQDYLLSHPSAGFPGAGPRASG